MATDPGIAAQEAPAVTVKRTVPCPACGVPVQLGYLRCPKCRAAVPQTSRSKRGSVRDQLLAGGTSVETEESSGGLGWVPMILLALAVIGIAVWVAAREGDDDEPGRESSAAGVTEGDEDDDGEEIGADEADEATPRPDRTPKAPDPMRAAVRNLDSALRAERLWANVSHEGSTVVLESALCEDVERQVGLHADKLREDGASAVTCHDRSGAVIWEMDL